MNRKKRFLALILSAILIVSLTAFSAMAYSWEGDFRGFQQISAANGAKNSFTIVWQRFLMCYSSKYAEDLAQRGGTDGIFGDTTKKYTIEYQNLKGLTADGIVGANTWGRMEKDLEKLPVVDHTYFRRNSKIVLHAVQRDLTTQFFAYKANDELINTAFYTTYG